MSAISNDDTQSGGVNFLGGTVNTGGGDVVGRDKFGGDNRVTFEPDRSHENIVEILRVQLDGMKNEITELRNETKYLRSVVEATVVVLGMVKITIGVHFLSANDYILHSCLFLKEKNLSEEFLNGLPPDVLRAGKKHD